MINLKNIKIAVDYDGTVCRTMDFVCDQINFKYNKNYTYKDIKNWTFWEDAGYEKDFWDIYTYMDTKGRLMLQPYDNYTLKSLSELNLITEKSFDILLYSSIITLSGINLGSITFNCIIVCDKILSLCVILL